MPQEKSQAELLRLILEEQQRTNALLQDLYQAMSVVRAVLEKQR